MNSFSTLAPATPKEGGIQFARLFTFLTHVTLLFLIVHGEMPHAHGTVIGDLASQMSPGTWAELPTLGINNGNFFETKEVGKAVTQWAHKGGWNPHTQQFLFLGAPHNNPWKFIYYNATTNKWENGPLPENCMTKDLECIGHGYDHNAIDTQTGNFYHRLYGTGNIYKYNAMSRVWEKLPPPPPNGFQVSGMMEFFPEMGGILLGDARLYPASLFFFNTSTGKWSTLATNLDLGPHSHISGYSEVNKVVIFGGGSNDKRSLYKIDTSGKITQLKNAPFNIRVGSTVLTPDPSGNFLVLQSDGSNQGFYEYDVSHDTWKLLDSNPPLLSFGPKAFDVIGAPVKNYGVIMYVKYYFDQTKIFLYKHQEGSGTPIAPDETPPTAPSNLQGHATSEAEVFLTWDPSTDNRGIAGYSIFRNGNKIGSASTTSYVDSSLPGTGFYEYFVLAFDAAGNQSPQSTSVTVEVKTNTNQGGSVFDGSNFSTRCQDVNVVRCFGFDSQAETDPHIMPPWRNRLTGVKLGVVDTSIKASGSGSLRFDIPSNVDADTSGTFWLNFSDDLSVQFGEGDDFYIQWRQRFSPELIDTLFYRSPIANEVLAGGWKQAIIGQGDVPGKFVGSCTPMELVLQNSDQRGFPQMYHSCGAKDGQYQGLNIPTDNDWLFQWDGIEGCARSLMFSNTDQPWNKRFTPPLGPCMGYRPNEWMTFQVHVHVGTWYKNDKNYHRDSAVEVWAAYEGQPSVKIINKTGYDLVNCAAGDTNCLNDPSVKYGKIWLLPYHTGKSADQTHPPAAMWFDELIISRSKIPDPPSTATSTAPAPPTNLQIKIVD
jgi:hypothetical protein